MLNNVELRVTLHRSSDEFLLMHPAASATAPKYTLEILDVAIYMRKVRLAASDQLGIERTLRTHNAVYPITRVETKIITVPKGNTTQSIDNIFLGI